jgi:glutamate racemase
LGCTHYPLIGDAIRNHLGDEITIINPWKEAAQKLPAYLATHPELWCPLGDGPDKKTRIMTTGPVAILRQNVARLLWPVANERDCLAVDV